jgi:hypothetical protein
MNKIANSNGILHRLQQIEFKDSIIPELPEKPESEWQYFEIYGIEYFINKYTHEVRTTRGALARAVELKVGHRTFREAIEGISKNHILEAKVPILQRVKGSSTWNIQSVTLYDEEAIYDIIAECAEQGVKKAIQLLRVIGKGGVRLYVYNAVGYDYASPGVLHRLQQAEQQAQSTITVNINILPPEREDGKVMRKELTDEIQNWQKVAKSQGISKVAIANIFSNLTNRCYSLLFGGKVKSTKGLMKEFDVIKVRSSNNPRDYMRSYELLKLSDFELLLANVIKHARLNNIFFPDLLVLAEEVYYSYSTSNPNATLPLFTPFAVDRPDYIKQGLPAKDTQEVENILKKINSGKIVIPVLSTSITPNSTYIDDSVAGINKLLSGKAN